MTTYWCEYAALPHPDGSRVVVEHGVVVEIVDGVFTSIRAGRQQGGANRLEGLTIPGFANCHSHAFHRALRARTQRGHGSFWTWREQMYGLAGRLDPDSYYALARAVYREMAHTGVTCVGEFHYLHHGADGTSYDDPNAFGVALIAAARDAGIRIALLDTCYLASGIGASPQGVQVRFGDGDAKQWRARVESLLSHAAEGVVIGAAIHSVRAVARDDVPVVSGWSADQGLPLHIHVSEQVAENEACQAAYGCTPVELLAEARALGPLTSVVHATHLTDRDIDMLGTSGTYVCMCPTTERDLGDGIGPARRLQQAGSLLTLGSDSHAVIDAFEEMRALELDERLATQLRGHWSSSELVMAGSANGHASLGFADAGRIEAGARADLVTIDLRTPRTAGGGATLENAVFAAGPDDIVQVIADGKVIASRTGRDAVGRELAAAIASAWGEG